VIDPTNGVSLVGIPLVERYDETSITDCDDCTAVQTCALPPNIDSSGNGQALTPEGSYYSFALNFAGSSIAFQFQIDAAIDYTPELVCGCIPIDIIQIDQAPAGESDIFCLRVSSCLTISSPDGTITVTNPEPGIWEISSPRSVVTDNGDNTYTHDDGAGTQVTWQAGITLQDCDGTDLVAGDQVGRCPVHGDGTALGTNGAGAPVIPRVVDGSGGVVPVDGNGDYIVCSCPVVEDPDNPGTYLDLPVSPDGAPIIPASVGADLVDFDDTGLVTGDVVSRWPVTPDGTDVGTNGAGRPIIPGVVDGTGSVVMQDANGNWIVCSCPVVEDPNNPGTYLALLVSPDGAPIVPGVVDGSGNLVTQDASGNWEVCSCPVIEDPNNPGTYLPLPVSPAGAPIVPPAPVNGIMGTLTVAAPTFELDTIAAFPNTATIIPPTTQIITNTTPCPMDVMLTDGLHGIVYAADQIGAWQLNRVTVDGVLVDSAHQQTGKNYRSGGTDVHDSTGPIWRKVTLPPGGSVDFTVEQITQWDPVFGSGALPGDSRVSSPRLYMQWIGIPQC
jgi:hypothetical protein